MPRAESLILSRRTATPLVVAVAGVAAALAQHAAAELLRLFGASAIVAAITLLGLGVVTGRAGMIALCQMSFATIGAWVVTCLNVIGAPGGLLWLPLGGIAAGILGMLVGLPRPAPARREPRGRHARVRRRRPPHSRPVQFPGDPGPGPAAGAVRAPTVVLLLRRDRAGPVRAHRVPPAATAGGAADGGRRLLRARHRLRRRERALGEAHRVRRQRRSAGISGGLSRQVQLRVAFDLLPPVIARALRARACRRAHLIDMAIFGGILCVLVPEILKQFGFRRTGASSSSACSASRRSRPARTSARAFATRFAAPQAAASPGSPRSALDDARRVRRIPPHRDRPRPADGRRTRVQFGAVKALTTSTSSPRGVHHGTDRPERRGQVHLRRRAHRVPAPAHRPSSLDGVPLGASRTSAPGWACVARTSRTGCRRPSPWRPS